MSGYFPAKTLSLRGKLALKNAKFDNENLFLGHFTWFEVHSIDHRQIWYDISSYMWRYDWENYFGLILFDSQ